MGKVNTKHIVIIISITIAAICGLYLFVMYSQGKLDDSTLKSLRVSASDNVDYVDENIVYSSINEKAGLNFAYYYDKDTCEYGIKVNNKYDSFSSDIKELYGDKGVFLVYCDQLQFIYIMIYDESNNTYSVKDIFKSTDTSAVLEVNKDYNGVHVNSVSYSVDIGWKASVDGGIKKALVDAWSYPEYTITTKYTGVEFNAKFNSKTYGFDFSINSCKINDLPRKDSDDKEYYLITVQLPVLNSNIMAKYDYDSKMWSVVKIANVPECKEANKNYDKDEVLFVEKYNIFVNILQTEEEDDEGKTQIIKKYQYFDKDGKFLFDCPCDTDPLLLEKNEL